MLPDVFTHTPVHPSFTHDVLDTHLIYDYDAADSEGNPQKWRYELWFFSANRVVYAVYGGPMKGRQNYQTCCYQCIRPGEIWQCNFLEETGTFVSLIWDIPGKTITSAVAFSKGHWDCPAEAQGDKRNPEDFARWRGFAELGMGAGKLKPVAPDAVTF